MAQRNSNAGLATAALVMIAWPTAALAQDITGLVVVAVPAVLAAPVAALFIKMIVLRHLSRRRLMAAALAELLLWAVVLPAGSLVKLRMLGLDYKHSAMATLVVCVVGAVSLNSWVLASGPSKRRLALALPLAALTPLAFLLIAWAVFAVMG